MSFFWKCKVFIIVHFSPVVIPSLKCTLMSEKPSNDTNHFLEKKRKKENRGRAKGLKLLHNSDWPCNWAGKMRRPSMTSTPPPGYTNRLKFLLYPSTRRPRRRGKNEDYPSVVFPGALLLRCLGRKGERCNLSPFVGSQENRGF